MSKNSLNKQLEFFSKIWNEAKSTSDTTQLSKLDLNKRFLSLIFMLPNDISEYIYENFSQKIIKAFPTAEIYSKKRLHSTLVGFGAFDIYVELKNEIDQKLKNILEQKNKFKISVRKMNVLPGTIICELINKDGNLESLVLDIRNGLKENILNIDQLIGNHFFVWWTTLSRHNEKRAKLFEFARKMPKIDKELEIDSLKLVTTDKYFRLENTEIIGEYKLV